MASFWGHRDMPQKPASVCSFLLIHVAISMLHFELVRLLLAKFILKRCKKLADVFPVK
jgi:hypothetical protein